MDVSGAFLSLGDCRHSFLVCFRSLDQNRLHALLTFEALRCVQTNIV